MSQKPANQPKIELEMAQDLLQITMCEPAACCPFDLSEPMVQAMPADLAECCHGFTIRRYP